MTLNFQRQMLTLGTAGFTNVLVQAIAHGDVATLRANLTNLSKDEMVDALGAENPFRNVVLRDGDIKKRIAATLEYEESWSCQNLRAQLCDKKTAEEAIFMIVQLFWLKTQQEMELLSNPDRLKDLVVSISTTSSISQLKLGPVQKDLEKFISNENFRSEVLEDLKAFTKNQDKQARIMLTPVLARSLTKAATRSLTDCTAPRKRWDFTLNKK